MMDLWLFSGTKLRTKFDTIKQKKMLIFQSTEGYTQEAMILFVKLSMFQLQQKRKILFLQ